MNTAGRKQGANPHDQVLIAKMAAGGIDPATNEEIPPLNATQIGQLLSIEAAVVEKFMPKPKRGRRTATVEE
jgi:hypothetical protein